MNVWKKIGGRWAVAGPDVQAFGTVAVTAKSGAVKEVHLGALAGVIEWNGENVDYAYPRENQEEEEGTPEEGPALTSHVWVAMPEGFGVIGPEMKVGRTYTVTSGRGRSKEVQIVRVAGTVVRGGKTYPVGYPATEKGETDA